MSAGERQVATLSLRAGAMRLRARVAMTPAGLVATSALVSSILLSTAVLVRVAVREGGRSRARVLDAGRAALPKKNDPSALDTLREDS